MKHFKTIAFAALLTASATCCIISCKKEDKEETKEETTVVPEVYECKTCSKTPDAKAENNESAKGIYKGVVIGSTGTIKFDIGNTGSAITGSLVIDGTKISLTTTTLWVAGQNFSAVFTGTYNSAAVSITFSVDSNGQNPAITAPNIPGHENASFLLLKETSTSLLEGFTGSFSTRNTSTPESGTFNMVLSRADSAWNVIIRKNGSTEVGFDGGSLVSNKLFDRDGKTIATINGDTLGGTFSNDNGEITTVTGRRSL